MFSKLLNCKAPSVENPLYLQFQESISTHNISKGTSIVLLDRSLLQAIQVDQMLIGRRLMLLAACLMAASWWKWQSQLAGSLLEATQVDLKFIRSTRIRLEVY